METPPGEAKKQLSAAELARLRRERRNAKIAAGGADRLAAITSLSGRPPPEPEEPRLTPKSQSQPPTQPTGLHAQNQQMQMPPFPSPGGAPFDGAEGADPMLAMLQQLLRAGAGGAGGAGGDPSAAGNPSQQDPFAGLPPGFAQLLGAATGGAGGAGAPGGATGLRSAGSNPSQQDPLAGLPPGISQLLSAAAGGQQPEPQQSGYEYIWRILHAVFSLLLGFYVALGTRFTGSEADRKEYVQQARFEDGLSYRFAERMFLVFATVEVGLQTTRYFLEKGQLPRSGILGKVSNMVPQPWANYVRVLGRYSVIWNTIAADALAVVFAFGFVSWLNSSR